MKNTGRKSEDIFDEAFQRMGKKAHVHVFTDSAEVRGMNKKAVMVKAQPADRMVTCDGEMFYAEIKSSVSSYDRFDFSLLRPKQSAQATMVLAAGGRYFVFYHHILTDEWFCIPYLMIALVKDQGKSSIPLSTLREQGRLWNPLSPSMM